MQVQLQYERVGQNRPSMKHRMNDPVEETFYMLKQFQEYELLDLPEGTYVVCGSAKVQGSVFQTNCLEATIMKLEDNSKS